MLYKLKLWYWKRFKPSRYFREVVGKWMSESMAKGFEAGLLNNHEPHS